MIRMMAPVTVRDHIRDLSTDLREEEALARAVVVAVERLEKKGSYGQFVVADARTMHAVALLKRPEADAREAGRGVLEQQVAVMERQVAPQDVVAGRGHDARRRPRTDMRAKSAAWATRVHEGPDPRLRPPHDKPRTHADRRAPSRTRCGTVLP